MFNRLVGAVAAAFALVVPTAVHADCYQPTGSGSSERVCFDGVFLPHPAPIELGAAIRVPVHYINETDRPMTFTTEMVGNVVFPGSHELHQATLDPHTEQTFPDLVFQSENTWPIGTDHIVMGWTATGSLKDEADYTVSVQRTIEVQILYPKVLQSVIQLPTRWCVVEGSAQAQGKHGGELISGESVRRLLQRANDAVWTPQAQIVFRSAIADGIPVVCDPDPPPTGKGVLGDLDRGGTGVVFDASRACERAWERIAPNQPGRLVVSGGSFHDAATILGETLGPGGVKHTSRLCSHPRNLTVLEVQGMEKTVLVDQALYGATGTPYSDFRSVDPAVVLAHELGHQLYLGHGNGLDDNHDGGLPPNPGTRRYDEFCDPLCANVDCDRTSREDDMTPSGTCETSSSVMHYSATGSCTKLRPLQAETARAAASLSPGAVVNGAVNPGDGRVQFGTDPCGSALAAEPASLIDDAGMTESGETTDFFQYVAGTVSSESTADYLMLADLDNDPATGCVPASLGLATTFQGAELVTRVSMTAGPTVSGTVWRCMGGTLAPMTDDRIEASIEPQFARDASAPAQNLVTIAVPNDVRGAAGDPVRLQALMQMAGDPSGMQRLPESDAGALVTRAAPSLPTCSLSQVAANPGGGTTVSVSALRANAAVEVYLGDERVARGTTDGAGAAQLDIVVPAASPPGVRPVMVSIPGTAVNAVCPLLVQGAVLTPATTASLSPVPNWNGWNKASVTVGLDAVDAPGGPGIASIEYSATGAKAIAPTSQAGAAADVVIDVQGTTELSYYAISTSGVTEAPRTSTVRIDTTAPTITFGGDLGPYGILEMLDITCTPSDALSGVATSTCENLSGPAYLLDPGANTVSATATDFADNVGSGSVTFTIEVTHGDLCTLTKQFIATSDLAASRAKLLGKSLCAQLTSAGQAAARGDAATEAKAILAYTSQVAANTPVVFTEEQAEILRRLAAAL